MGALGDDFEAVNLTEADPKQALTFPPAVVVIATVVVVTDRGVTAAGKERCSTAGRRGIADW